jgi:hypothetical protein
MPFHRAFAEQTDPEAVGILVEEYKSPEAPPVDIVVEVVVEAPSEIDMLRASVAKLTARVAELEAPPAEVWLPLKDAAAECAMVYETLRAACADGEVEARREGKAHWFVNVTNVKERQRRLGQRRK